MLTRHVGVCLVAAVVLDGIGKKPARLLLRTLIAAGVVVLPWVIWMASVGHQTQVELLPGRNLVSVAVENAVFYLRRIPDQVVGPVVEVATVFRPAFGKPATVAAAVASGVVVWGWMGVLRSRRRRIAGLVPLATLGLLLVWPFTEAGRFLVPLIPFILVGAVEGSRRIFMKMGKKRGRTWAASLILAASLPYSIYAIASGRSDAARRSHEAFDRACRWIESQAEFPGAILTRHPGEAFLRSGRRAVAPPEGASMEIIETWIRNYHVGFLLIDEARFANAPTTPLERYVAARPNRVERVHGDGLVVVYRVIGLTDGRGEAHNP